MKRILKVGLTIAIGYALYRLLAEYRRPISVRLDQPRREPTPPEVSEEATHPPAAKPTRLDINRADAHGLTSLPGIGPILAERVVAYRSENGPYASIDDLTRVRGIGMAQVNRIRKMVSVET